MFLGGTAEAAPKRMVGKPAPDFTGAKPFGPAVSITQFKGKVPLILTFWSIYCKTCVEEMGGLQKLYEKYGPGKVAVVAVNEDADVGVERVKAFLDRQADSPGGKITYPVLFDGKGEVFKAYNVMHLPTLFFIDAEGVVRESIEGFEPGKEPAVMSAIEKLLGAVGPEAIQEVTAEASFDLDVEMPLCGTYRDGKWYRPLDLDETRQDVLARARAEGEAHLRKEAVRLALVQLGVVLRSEEQALTCGVAYGIEQRSAYRKKDALDRFVDQLNLPRVLEVEGQETVERERDLSLYRRIKVFLPALREQLTRNGYSTGLSDLRIRFARATYFEERAFIQAVEGQYPFLSSLRRLPPDVRGRAEYLLSSHASPAIVAGELQRLDVGARKVSVELLPGGILEVSMWR
jgi:peroxiredoxin